MQKVRLIQFVVNVVAVIDDGENLTPIDGLKPIVIRAAEWQKFAASGPAELLAELQRQLDVNDSSTTSP